MPYNPDIHHRRSPRLQEWDYSWPSWYYVTIVVSGRQCVFGKVQVDKVTLSALGAGVNDCWTQIPQHHAGVELDEFRVMPNHLHGIVIINDSVRRDVQLNVPTNDTPILFSSKSQAMGALSPKKNSLSVVMPTFKGAVTT